MPWWTTIPISPKAVFSFSPEHGTSRTISKSIFLLIFPEDPPNENLFRWITSTFGVLLIVICLEACVGVESFQESECGLNYFVTERNNGFFF